MLNDNMATWSIDLAFSLVFVTRKPFELDKCKYVWRSEH
jgi:hypothetical protein